MLKRSIILIVLLCACSSAVFCDPSNWRINVGKEYSSRFVRVSGDDRSLISRTSLSVDYSFQVNEKYTMGVELFGAMDDAVLSSISGPTYGDLLSGFSVINEFPLEFGRLKPYLDIGTGLYSIYYFQRNSRLASDTDVISDITWVDMSLGLRFELSPMVDLKIKIEPLLSYLFVYQDTIPVSVSLGAKF